MLIKASVLGGWGPGGWMFYQPETNWHAPGPLENNFEQQVANIIAMRKANPRFNLPLDHDSVSDELQQYTVARWKATYSTNGLQKFLANPMDLKKKAHTSTVHRPSLLGRVAGLAGIDSSVIEEWLGAGGVSVPVAQASNRASICASCTGNDRHTNLLDLLTAPAALALKAYLQAKNQMQLATPLDDQLGVCRACRCHLGLKVFTPNAHIEKHMTDALRAKLSAENVNCWVLTGQ